MNNTEYVLSLSYGKDSVARLGAIKLLGLPLHRVIHAEVWATDTIHADLPPMVDFKAKVDEYIKTEFGIDVEHLCAMRNGEKLTYEKLFYHVPKRRYQGKWPENSPMGFPFMGANWCNGELKAAPLDSIKRLDGGGGDHRVPLHNRLVVQRTPQSSRLTTTRKEQGTILGFPIRGGAGVRATSNAGFSNGSLAQGAKTNIVQYLGIAADEPKRIERHGKPGFRLPLVEAGWDEAYCRQWCEERGLLSPIYTTATRGGCWFCHNQGIDQLRLLRKTYPEYWQLLLKWDRDSPTTFKADGHMVHDYDLRFQAEDLGLVPTDRKFRWKMLTGKTLTACKCECAKRNMMKLLEEVSD